jgi:cell division protein FtsB
MSFEGFSGLRLRTPVILPVVAALLVSYFAFYTFFGERSLLRLMQLEKQTHAAADQLAAIKAEQDALAAKVNHLRPSSIDPDLLDQQARHVLNYTAPGEIVIMNKSGSVTAAQAPTGTTKN